MALQTRKQFCPHCGSRYRTFVFEGEAQLYCPKCQEVIYNVSRPIDVYIGRVVKALDRRTHTFRMILEYPLNLTGRQMVVQLVPYDYVVHLKTTTKWKVGYKEPTVSAGDRVAVGGSMVENAIEAYFCKNLTVGLEEYLMPTIEAKVGIFKRIEVDHPYAVVAEKKVRQAVPLFESDKGKVSAPVDYHARARDFEILVSQLLEKLGFRNMTLSGGAGDKGVDIEGYMLDEGVKLQKILVQCKHQSITNLVKPTQVRDFAHAIERENAYRGYFVTSSFFSPECFFRENCGDHMILIDRDELQKLLKEHELTLDSVEGQ